MTKCKRLPLPDMSEKAFKDYLMANNKLYQQRMAEEAAAAKQKAEESKTTKPEHSKKKKKKKRPYNPRPKGGYYLQRNSTAAAAKRKKKKHAADSDSEYHDSASDSDTSVSKEEKRVSKKSKPDTASTNNKRSLVDQVEVATAPPGVPKKQTSFGVELIAEEKVSVKKAPAKKVPPAKQYDNRNDYLEVVRKQYPKKSNPAAKAKPWEGKVRTENKKDNRFVGEFADSEKQQFDGHFRKQYRMSLRHEETIQRMATPTTKTGGYVPTNDEESKTLEATQDAWADVIPFKGIYTEMKPNKGGSAPVERLPVPRITIQVPTSERGDKLIEAIKNGTCRLEFVHSSEELMSTMKLASSAAKK